MEAIVFDTTASNTGKWSGSITLFEGMLGRAMLWLACMHHIPELFIKYANTEVRGPSKGSDDQLFKAFKEKFEWKKLNERTCAHGLPIQKIGDTRKQTLSWSGLTIKCRRERGQERTTENFWNWLLYFVIPKAFCCFTVQGQ